LDDQVNDRDARFTQQPQSDGRGSHPKGEHVVDLIIEVRFVAEAIRDEHVVRAGRNLIEKAAADDPVATEPAHPLLLGVVRHDGPIPDAHANDAEGQSVEQVGVGISQRPTKVEIVEIHATLIRHP